MVLPDSTSSSSGHASSSARPGRYNRADPMFFKPGQELEVQQVREREPDD